MIITSNYFGEKLRFRSEISHILNGLATLISWEWPGDKDIGIKYCNVIGRGGGGHCMYFR